MANNLKKSIGSGLFLTHHANRRMYERGFSNHEVLYVLEHGSMLHRSGVCFYFLAARNIPTSDYNVQWIQRLVGTIVLLGLDGYVITVYRDRSSLALHKIKKKAKWGV